MVRLLSHRACRGIYPCPKASFPFSCGIQTDCNAGSGPGDHLSFGFCLHHFHDDRKSGTGIINLSSLESKGEWSGDIKWTGVNVSEVVIRTQQYRQSQELHLRFKTLRPLYHIAFTCASVEMRFVGRERVKWTHSFPEVDNLKPTC